MRVSSELGERTTSAPAPLTEREDRLYDDSADREPHDGIPGESLPSGRGDGQGENYPGNVPPRDKHQEVAGSGRGASCPMIMQLHPATAHRLLGRPISVAR